MRRDVLGNARAWQEFTRQARGKTPGLSTAIALAGRVQPARTLAALRGTASTGVLAKACRLIHAIGRNELLSRVGKSQACALNLNFDVATPLVMCIAVLGSIIAVRVYPELTAVLGPCLRSLLPLWAVAPQDRQGPE
jgi:hypothetical protein